MNKDISAEVGTDRLTAARWRRRFAERGLSGIEKDEPWGGRKPTRRNKVARLIVERTTQKVPINATHWSPPMAGWRMNSMSVRQWCLASGRLTG